MPRITEKGKLQQHRGEGTGKDYKPWIKISELNSQGTATEVIDYKHGRNIQLLSQGEMYYYYLLRWRDDVADIREQYPLNLELTLNICEKLNYKHPHSDNTRMTTDLLVTKTDGSLEAYSIKYSKNELDNPRTLEKLYIEKLYWNSFKIPFHIRYTTDVNKTLVNNIMDVTTCYNPLKVQTKQDAIRHKIAIKEIIVDMESELLNYNNIINLYLTKDGD